MLAPGFSGSFHMHTLQRSDTSIRRYRREAKAAARSDPTIEKMAHQLVSGLKAEDGLAMARSRGRSQMPHWSRMAISAYRDRGHATEEIAKMFFCSPSTVRNVLRGCGGTYHPLSGLVQRMAKLNLNRPRV